MKTKGARLTTEISLPGRFVVYVPHGDGLGVSRRLEDDERNRLKGILKEIAPKTGGVIVRTAAEGASAEDVERDLEFLMPPLEDDRDERAKKAKAPALIYQEAELPLRVTRDLFTGDFERLVVDHDRTYKRIVGYLKKTSPHMVERVDALQGAHAAARGVRGRAGDPVDAQPARRPALGRLPDLRLRRGVHGHRRQHRPLRRLALEAHGAGRLEDTITKNNLEAVKEVVRQLRLRDIGGIIVIDFIDMANPKNRAAGRGGAAPGARARPDEDLRRRDLAARPRRDDAPERHRRPARGDDAQVPDLRRRRHRRLRGRRPRSRSSAGCAGSSRPARARRRSRSRSTRRSRRCSSGPTARGCTSSRS